MHQCFDYNMSSLNAKHFCPKIFDMFNRFKLTSKFTFTVNACIS